ERATIVWDRRTSLTDTSTHQIFYVTQPYLVFERLAFYQTPISRSVSLQAAVTNQFQRIHGISIWGDNVTVRNCSVDNMSGVGVYVSKARFLVEGSTITGTDSHGFYIAGADGIYRNNRLDGGNGYGNQQGMQIQYVTSTRNKIYGNVITNGQAAGVVFSGQVSYNEVFNNIFIGCGHKADGSFGVVLNYWHQDGAIGPGNKFYNNTILGPRPNSGLIHTIDGANVDTFNNIFRPDTATPVGGAAGFLIRNNLFFNATGIPSGNLSGDPRLANPLGQDETAAKLLTGSAAIDKAVAGAPATDFAGVSRPQGAASDIGAYEYTGAAAPAFDFMLTNGG
ncbi:MAG: right-handed parallel beta-helix repeat-containing protein, partial [Chloroflexota bacterium]